MEFYKTSIRLVKESYFDYNVKQIKDINDVVNLVNNIEDISSLDVENLFLICLNNKNNPINYSLISKGNLNSSIIDFKSIFKNVLLSNASGFLLVHNHPSGDSTPSNADYAVTKKLKEASKFLDIKFLDHIVIGDNNYTSCMEV